MFPPFRLLTDKSFQFAGLRRGPTTMFTKAKIMWVQSSGSMSSGRNLPTLGRDWAKLL